MRDDDSDDTPMVLLRLLPERELPRCRCGAAYTIGVTTGPDTEAYYCDDCYVVEHSRAAYAARQSQLTVDKQTSRYRPTERVGEKAEGGSMK
jgi:hypothetical protein